MSGEINVTDEILAIYRARGAGAYFGEHLSMTEHAQQAAHFARADGAPQTLIVAALLHDIGHLLEPAPDAIEDWTADARHEVSGAHWLAQRFGAEISEPVRLHVSAKRYLCWTEASYFARLSPASVHTLELQGGPMSAHEAAQFEGERFYKEAVAIRRWDDQGKVPGLVTASLGDYVALIAAAARQSPRRDGS
jgi:phosphonate degradation associated HDIG domain protein